MTAEDLELGVADIYSMDQDAGAGATGVSGVTSVAAGGTGIAPGQGGSIPSYNSRKKRKAKMQVPQNSASKM